MKKEDFEILVAGLKNVERLVMELKYAKDAPPPPPKDGGTQDPVEAKAGSFDLIDGQISALNELVTKAEREIAMIANKVSWRSADDDAALGLAMDKSQRQIRSEFYPKLDKKMDKPVEVPYSALDGRPIRKSPQYPACYIAISAVAGALGGMIVTLMR